MLLWLDVAFETKKADLLQVGQPPDKFSKFPASTFRSALSPSTPSFLSREGSNYFVL